MADILITGGAGFIGSHLARRLLQQGDSVHIITRSDKTPDRMRDIAGKINIHHADLSDSVAIARCLNTVKPEKVFHLATTTRPPRANSMLSAIQAVEEDVINMMKLVSAMAEMSTPPQHFIRAGTLAEYGDAPAPYLESAREDPVTAYGAAALSGTHYLNAMRDQLPFSAATARLALVYGPTQSTKFLVPKLIDHCLTQKPFTIEGPQMQRDLIYIDDVVDGLVRLGEAAPLETCIINLCTGAAPTMREVGEIIIKETGAPPSLVQFGNGSETTGAAHLCGSPDLADVILDWRAQTSIAEGVEKCIAHARAANAHSGQ